MKASNLLRVDRQGSVGSNPSHLHRPQSKPKQAMQAESMSAVLMQQTINLKAASGMKTSMQAHQLQQGRRHQGAC